MFAFAFKFDLENKVSCFKHFASDIFGLFGCVCALGIAFAAYVSSHNFSCAKILTVSFLFLFAFIVFIAAILAFKFDLENKTFLF